MTPAPARAALRAVPVLVIAAALLAVPAAPAGAAQGSGDPTLTVSATTLPTDRVSTVTVTGTGYLVPPHAPDVDVFGGVYVFFGWVADPDRFGPSIRSSSDNDGTFGVTYAYPGGAGDASTRDDGSGAVRLVSFTAGGESGEATDYHMDEDGNWSTTLRIFGSEFTATTPSGETLEYDCREVQCGVFTVGAHGIASATNEKFAPVSFRTGADPVDPPPGAPDATATAPADEDGGRPGGSDPTTATGGPTRTPGPDPVASGDLAPGAGGDDGGTLDVAARSVRSTGGAGTTPVLAAVGVVAALAVAALAGTAWLWRRRRRPRATDGATETGTARNAPIEPVSPTPEGGTST